MRRRAQRRQAIKRKKRGLRQRPGVRRPGARILRTRLPIPRSSTRRTLRIRKRMKRIIRVRRRYSRSLTAIGAQTRRQITHRKNSSHLRRSESKCQIRPLHRGSSFPTSLHFLISKTLKNQTLFRHNSEKTSTNNSDKIPTNRRVKPKFQN